MHSHNINLFLTIKNIVNCYKLVILFILISVCISIILISMNKPGYSSKIFITTSDALPIMYHNKAKDDFKKLFYSKNFFESWKSQNNISISYSDLLKYERQNNRIQGLEYLEPDTSVFILGKRGPSYIFLKTDEYKLISSYFDYAKYINDNLTKKYISKIETEIETDLKKYEKKYKKIEFKQCHVADIECTKRQKKIINTLIELDLYSMKLNQGSKIFDIQTPSLPTEIPRNIFKTIIISVIYGLAIGIIFISYLSSSKNKDKLNMNKIEENSIDLNLVNFIKLILKNNHIIFFITLSFLFTSYLTALIDHPNKLSSIEINLSTKYKFYYSNQNHHLDMYYDFKKLLYTENIFKSWQKENASVIVFDNFSNTLNIDGDYYTRENESMLVFDINKKKAALIVKSDSPLILNDFYNYAGYINEILTNRYKQDAESERGLIEKRYGKVLSQNEIIFNKILHLDGLINLYNKDGENIFMISPPKEIYLPMLKAINMLIAMVLGLFIAILYVVVRDSYQKKLLITKKL